MNLPSTRLLLLALLCSAGCPSEQKGFNFALQLVEDTDCSKGATTSLGKGFKVRLTFMRRSDKSVGPANLRDFELICDRVIVPKEEVEFTVDSKAGQVIGVRVEAFDADNQLQRFGENLGVDLWRETETIYLRPAGRSSCVDPTRRLHAFHTATVLPNGQVAIIGGVTADGGGDNLSNKAVAFGNGAVEIYDPSRLKVLVTRKQGELPGRAFHRAVLLPSPVEGPYKLLLVGGLQGATADGPILRLRATGVTAYPFLFSPHESAVGAETALLTLTLNPDGEDFDIQYEPLPEIPRVMFPATTLNDARDALLVVPGASTYDATETTVDGFAGAPLEAFWINLTDPPTLSEDTVDLERVRVGHAVARLGTDRFVIVGGAMDGPADSEQTFVAAAFSSGDSVVENVSPSTGDPTAWHTLVPIGQGDRASKQESPTAALWAGGFALTKGDTERFRSAVDFAAGQRTLQLLYDGTPLTVVNKSALGGFELTAYHDALRLHDGSVMITGGNTPGASPFSTSGQVAVVRLGSNGIELAPSSAPDGLALARFGHRSTRLLDNTVLITGGIALKEENTPIITTKTEILAPRVGDASEDYPFDRAAATAKSPCPVFGEDSKAPATTGQLSSAMVTATRPDPRTGKNRRIRTARLPSGRVRVRIDFGTVEP